MVYKQIRWGGFAAPDPSMEVQLRFPKTNRVYAMTSTGPRNLIRYPKFPPRMSTINISDNGKYHPSSGANQNRCQSDPVAASPAVLNIDQQLHLYENIARKNFLMIKNGLRVKKLSRWLDQKLERGVLPTLECIGFDRSIARALFEITPAEWRFMGPVNEKIIVLRPDIHHDIKEVLSGLKPNGARNDGSRPGPAKPSLAVMTGSIDDNLSPENLFELLDTIDISWITLPRVFRFLERGHNRYLTEYLKTIESRTSEFCLKVFSRITTEFMGNFALKFADGHHSRDQIEKLLFYGYSALYWKNLRKPPTDLENCSVFDHFLNWVSRLARHSKFLGSDEVRSVCRMTKMKSMVFPPGNINQPQTSRWSDSSRFWITLRHGTIGAETVLKYFGIDQFLKTRQKQGNSPFQSRPNQLYRFLFRIQINIHDESKKTREYIQQFIGHLKRAFEVSQPAAHPPEKRFLYRMINNLYILLNK